MLQSQSFKSLGTSIILSASIFTSVNANAQAVIKIDGSSTVYPITQSAASQFQAEKKNAVNITVEISGSGDGFKRFCRGEIDIVNASRPILKSEMKHCKKAHVQYIEIPVAFDALTVAINPGNYWGTKMTVAQLKKIWEPAAQGKITRWSQINPAWPDEPIKLLGTHADSGTYDYFTKAIVGKSKSSRQDFTQLENNAALIDNVAGDKNSLAFLGFAYYIENQNKITAVAIDNYNGAVLPSVETVEDGSYQPLSRPIFIYVNAKAADRPEIDGFIEFYMKNAILLVKEAKFFPLPPRAYPIMLDLFNKRRVGSVFIGKPAVDLTIDDLLRSEGRTEFEHF